VVEEAEVPKVSVYLPEEFYRRARGEGLPIPALAQAAMEEAIAAKHNQTWIDAVRARDSRTTHEFDTSELLSEVRDQFGA
jgi:post-segregation antitoxin (ccd killing protein)